MSPGSRLHLAMPGAAGLDLELATVALRGYRSRARKRRLIRGQYVRRRRRRVVFRGRDVGWIEIRCLMLGIPGTASVGYTSAKPRAQ